jgi:hypothetical protein
MSRLAWAAALAAMLVVSGCAPSGVLDGADPTTPGGSAAPGETASGDGGDATDAPGGEPGAPEAPDASATPNPSATPGASATPPAAPALPPPPIGLPQVEPPLTELPVSGAVAGAGARDLYVACSLPTTVWTGGTGTRTEGLVDGTALDCRDSWGGAVVQLGVPAGATRAHAVLEADAAAPLIVRMPAGRQLDTASRAGLARGFGSPTALDVSVACTGETGRVTVGGIPFDCWGDGLALRVGVDRLGGPMPSIVADAGVTATVFLRPVEG